MNKHTMYLLLERYFFHLVNAKLIKSIRKEIQKLNVYLQTMLLLQT